MGNTGSFTTKANIDPNLFVFTTWNTVEMNEFLLRGQKDLSEVFGLRKHEFEFLLGNEMVDFNSARALFNTTFDTDKNGIVDKFEVMCVVCLASKLSNLNKIHFFFDLFNFNNKGYLYESEVTLLLMAVTRGAYKVDQKYVPPNAKIINNLVKECMTFTRVDPNVSVRKPELVNFILENKDALAFLETWRGHASQVLLGTNIKWRDLSFPANELSIIPSRHWLQYGLPPGNFVKWRRCNMVGANGLGCIYLFTHEVSFLKTVDRKVVYEGDGVIGRGYLKQGLLANRWYLNALSAMIASPFVIQSVFAATGQESAGRYCCRFYEGTGWRSVYVDDRLPCSPDRNPMFCSSSNGLELWPLILEKAYAKYFGSYAQFAANSVRHDGSFAALRMLTGGHVLKLYTKFYDWKSVDDEVKGENGVTLVKKALEEGSLVSLGRSEPLSLMSRRGNVSKQNQDPFIIPPHGRLFPILGCIFVKGYQYFVLRDAWNLINDVNNDVNPDTGHCNTFQIKVDDVPFLYDTLVVCKFPDALRATAESRNLQPWNTNVVSGITNGVNDPARFVLTVEPKTEIDDEEEEEIPKNTRNFRKIPTVQEVLSEMDKVRNQQGKKKDEDEAFAKTIRLKDKANFSRDKPKFQRRGAAVQEGTEEEEAPVVEKKDNFVEMLAKLERQMVDVVFTVSSSCDYSFAGSKEAGAKLRLRLTPSHETFKNILDREKQLVDIKQRAKAMLEAKRAAQEKLIEIVPTDVVKSDILDVVGDRTADDASVATADTPATANSAAVNIVKHLSPAEILAQKANTTLPSFANAKAPPPKEIIFLPPKIEDIDVPEGVDREDAYREKSFEFTHQFDATIAEGCCWQSRAVKLLPGEYYMYADVAYTVPYSEAFRLTVPNDIAEAPWLHGVPAAESGGPTASATAPAAAELFDSQSLEGQSTKSTLHHFGTPIHAPSNNRISSPDTPDISRPNSPQKAISMAVQDTVAVPPPRQGVDPTLYNLHKIHVQMSCVEKFELNAVDKSYFPPSVDCSVEYLKVPEETWPFMTETQSEVASRELVKMIAELKQEATVTGLEFVSLTNKFKDDRKVHIAKSNQVRRDTVVSQKSLPKIV